MTLYKRNSLTVRYANQQLIWLLIMTTHVVPVNVPVGNAFVVSFVVNATSVSVAFVIAQIFLLRQSGIWRANRSCN